MTYVVRAARASDLDALYNMAKTTGGGFTNLPASKAALRRKLDKALASFAREGDQPDDDQFLFVLENTHKGRVVGTCQVFSRTGWARPFHSYRLGAIERHSDSLGRTFRARTLTFCTDLDGLSEVGGLFLHPQERAAGVGKLLARSRYLFIKMHRARFADRTIAELRGAHDAVGRSPFWDGLAGRFFDMSFADIDTLTAAHGSQAIAELMPEHTIYPALLPESAQAVLGVPHRSGTAAMRMLEEEGFAGGEYIDVFDGGPTMIAETDAIRTIAEAETSPLVEIAAGETGPHLVAAGKLGEFCACIGGLSPAHDGVAADAGLARTLGVELGATLVHATV